MCSSAAVWKSKNYDMVSSESGGVYGYGPLTLIVPSCVLAMTTLFNGSLARPVTPRYFCDVAPACTRAATAGGAGPTLNVLRLIPDCMLYM